MLAYFLSLKKVDLDLDLPDHFTHIADTQRMPFETAVTAVHILILMASTEVKCTNGISSFKLGIYSKRKEDSESEEIERILRELLKRLLYLFLVSSTVNLVYCVGLCNLGFGD
jgi:hypothetical protein